MGRLFLIFSIVASSLFAADATLLVLPNGKVFALNSGFGGQISWEEAPRNAVNAPVFDPRVGSALTVRGRTQFFRNERQANLVRIDEAGAKEVVLPLSQIAAGKMYQRVLRDKAGNLYGEILGGGFTFTHFDKHFSMTPEEVEYSAESSAATRFVPNPRGSGAFFLDETGENVILARPPDQWGHEFKTKTFRSSSFAQGRLKRLMLVTAGDEIHLAAMTASGTFGLIEFEDSALSRSGGAPSFLPIAFPSNGPPDVNADIRSPFDALPRTASTSALALLDSGDHVIRTIGTDRVMYRDGKMIRVGRHGETIPVPGELLKKLKLESEDDKVVPFLAAVRINHTDSMARYDHFGEKPPFMGRADEIERILDILVRTSGNHPIVTGDIGSGRSAIAPLLAQALFHSQYVSQTRFAERFNDALVVETTPELITRYGNVTKYFNGLRSAEARLGRPIITVLTRMEQMGGGDYAKLEELMQNDPALLIVGVSTSKYTAELYRKNPEFPKTHEIVRLLGMNDEQTRKILTEVTAPKLAETYRTPEGPATISAEAIEIAIKRGKQIFPDLAYPEGPRRLLEDMTIVTHRTGGAGAVNIDDKAARTYIKKVLALPFDPENQAEFAAAIADLRVRLNNKIVDQERVVNWLVDAYRDIIQPNAKKRHRTVLLLGPTGGGKTYSLQTAFKEFFRDEQRILEIDCTKYLEKEALTTLLGSWPGYVGSEKLGVLPQFLSEKGRNFNGIIFNEWEKASKELANAVMEMMDTGVLTDSHGNRFHLGTSIIGLTSNKGDKVFFPRNSKLTRAEQEKRAAGATSDDVKQRFLEPEPDQVYDTKNNHTPANMQRIDGAFFMLPPSNEGAKRMLREMTAPELEAELSVKFSIDEATLDAIIEHKYVHENGVREPQRALKDLLRAAYHGVSDNLPAVGPQVVEVTLIPSESEPAISVTMPGSEAPAKTMPVTFIPKTQIPLEDPVTREKIRTLRSRMEGKVFGQEPAIDTLAKSIINQRYVDPDPERPGVAGFFGPTGTGKSALAEVVGEVEFGAPERTRSFQLGNIRTMDDVDNLFGTARGRAGSDSPAEFEQFLQQYPEGGVLHFEEIGNVGADNPRVRDAVFRILYSILEGKWTNAHGKTYKTGKFFIVFSSNEGQELFADAPADDLRMAIYKRSKSQEQMRELLREHKWPEPLIGRMQGHLILFKPLIAQDRIRIAQKFFDGVLGRLKRRYPVNVMADDAFLAAAGETFFSHDQGARAVRDFFEEEVRSLFSTSFAEIYEKHGAAATAMLKASQFKLEIRDNYAGKNYFVGPRPDDRKVELTIKLVDPAGNLQLDLTSDITEMAPERHLPSKRSLLKTAYHEAGHVVGNDPLVTGQETDHVTIVGKGNYGGYARPITISGQGQATRARSVAYIGMLFAARVTEAYAGYEPDSGWSQDLKMARSAAERAVALYGLTERALGLPSVEGKVDMESEVTQKEIERLLQDGFKYAAARIKSRWAEVRLLTYRLFKKQAMDRQEIYATLEEARKQDHPREPKQTCIAILETMEKLKQGAPDVGN